MKAWLAIIFIILTTLSFASNQDLTEMRRSFATPPDDTRIMMRWWWFGPAVDKAELEREMKLMKGAGIGGFEVQPVYPIALDDAVAGIKNSSYLSDEFLEALRFASNKSRDLGLRMDLTLGSGWPYGGAQVPIRDAAGKLRIVRIRIPEGARRLPMPSMASGEKFIAAFLNPAQAQPVNSAAIRELTEITDNAVTIPTIQGAHEALFFISSRSGMMVKRPAFGAEGFVLNHYDKSAVDGYLRNVGDRLMQALRPNPPYAIFCDSLEVYESDWTDDFLEEFRQRRGYDLKPLLPALALNIGPQTAAIRSDWGKTLTELFNDRFMIPVHQWSQKNKTLLRVQGYGIPPATIASNAYADLSEGEGAQWKQLSASRWAASANHMFGRLVTSSETWTWLHSPSFRATPLDMKAEANLHFLQGVNQLIGHGWPYSPESADYPGWRFYAAGAFNDKNPWWIAVPEVTRYLQRASFLLRQGQPANDIAVYLSNADAYAGFTSGRTNLIESLRSRIGSDAIAAILDAGFNFDFFDDDSLRRLGKVESGSLALGPNRYRTVVLPNVERIPQETYRMLADFSRSGGALIASRRQPDIVPGFTATAAENDQIRQTSQRLFSSSKTARFIDDEKTQFAAALRAMLQPDVAFTPESPAIGFVHRKTNSADIYFLANSSNAHHTAKALIRISGRMAEWWDPMSGRITPAEISINSNNTTSVELDLEPYDSRFLVFYDKVADQAHTASKPEELASLDLSEVWRVTFGKTGISKTMEHLSSWIDDEATRYFSGVAVYEKTVPVPENMLQPGLSLQLDFGAGHALTEERRTNGMQAWFEGPVREAAEVYINDQRAGSVWCPPYRLDITGLMKRGDNKIRILAANTAINHMAGRSLPDYRLLNLRYGTRFELQDMDKIQPIASGLLGAIRLIATKQ
jgi:hypothetical protein